MGCPRRRGRDHHKLPRGYGRKRRAPAVRWSGAGLTNAIAAPVAKLGPQTLTLVDGRVFGLDGETLARRFARRVLRFPEVRSLALDPARSSATLAFHAAHGDPADCVIRLAQAVAGTGDQLEEVAVPRWPANEPGTPH